MTIDKLKKDNNLLIAKVLDCRVFSEGGKHYPQIRKSLFGRDFWSFFYFDYSKVDDDECDAVRQKRYSFDIPEQAEFFCNKMKSKIRESRAEKVPAVITPVKDQ